MSNRSNSSLASKLIAAPYFLWAMIFIVVPLFFVLYYALTDSKGNFTLENFTLMGMYSGVFISSIWYGLIATVICLALAYPLAYIIARSKGFSQKTLIMLVMLPMWMNLLIRTYAWTTILQDTGIINTFLQSIGLSPVHMIHTPGAVILGMVYNFFPYMILPIYTVMAKLDYSLIEAAQDLGCNTFSVLRKIIFPLSVPGVVSGITMVFVPSVSTFYISQKLGNMKLIGDVIESQFKQANNYNVGATLSLILMFMILICLIVMNKFTDDEEGGLLV